MTKIGTDLPVPLCGTGGSINETAMPCERGLVSRREQRLLATAIHRALSAEFHSRRHIESIRRSMERAAIREADKDAGLYWASREAARTAQRTARIAVDPVAWEKFKRRAERQGTTVGELLERLAPPTDATAHDAIATPKPIDGGRRVLFVRIAIDDDAWLELRHLARAAGCTIARYLGLIVERTTR